MNFMFMVINIIIKPKPFKIGDLFYISIYANLV